MKLSLCILTLLVLNSLIGAQSRAVFSFSSNDSANTGFNDPTPTVDLPIVVDGRRDIIGDNPGETLGELRFNVLNAAGEAWANFLLSDVPIEVEVEFRDQGGSDASGRITLASAGPETLLRNFTGAPQADTMYPVALANSLAGQDLRVGVSDIRVNVNSNSELSGSLLANGDLPDLVWYYGLDNNGPNGTVDFLSVLIHELGHGLGFVSTVSLNSGAYSFGVPDIYTRNIFDDEAQKYWTEMTSTERLASAANAPNLTWDGEFTRSAVDGVSEYLSSGISSGLPGGFPAAQAVFGGSAPSSGLLGKVVLVDDGSVIDDTGGSTGSIHDAAQDIINGSQVSGNIALIERGVETFYAKAQRAEAVGAIAVILLNNRDGDDILTPNAGIQSAPVPTIPVILISENSGSSLRASLSLNPDLEVVFTNERIFTDTTGVPVARARLFAPASISPGSSVSHWSSSAFPNLLMEPNISSGLSRDLDLSPVFMKDIGWPVANIGVPHLKYSQWLEENELVEGAANTGELDDLDQDGVNNLLEYFHGSDPNLASSRDSAFIDSGDSSSLSFKVNRSIVPNDLLFYIEQSSDLGTNDPWADVSASLLTNTLPNQQEQVTLPIDSDSEEEFFFRLRVEKN